MRPVVVTEDEKQYEQVKT